MSPWSADGGPRVPLGSVLGLPAWPGEEQAGTNLLRALVLPSKNNAVRKGQSQKECEW